jgi:hypothetical protein
MTANRIALLQLNMLRLMLKRGEEEVYNRY